MPVFIITVLVVYTLMHTLVYWGVRPLLTMHPLVPSLTMAWMGLMVASPFAVRYLEKFGSDAAARGAAWVGYSWMGFVWLAFAVFAVIGLADLALKGLSHLTPALGDFRVHGALTSAAAALFVAGVGIYGFQEAKDLRVETVYLKSPKPIPGGKVIRIAQVSDVHLGLINREDTLAPIILKLQALSPDILLATGDIVDAQVSHLNGLSDLWKEVNPPLGKYAINGNHEHYAGVEEALGFFEKSGFKTLRGDTVTPGGLINITGVDDWEDSTPALLKKPANGLYTILMKHRPNIADGDKGLFDLQTSGHTHHGQIFPFYYLSRIAFPTQNGLYEYEGYKLYVNRGTGTWGPPMRVLAPPEITIFEISG